MNKLTYFQDHIADIIDGDKKKSHSRVSKDIEDQIQNKDNKLLSGRICYFMEIEFVLEFIYIEY